MLQVHDLCTAGAAIWMARVPLICWRRVEWHLPDRVMRQFGAIQRIDMQSMEAGFERVDGRGKADVDWVQYHQRYIQLWDSREALVVQSDEHLGDSGRWLKRYMRWYRSWASLYLLKAPKQAPTTYYPRSPGERLLRTFFLETEATVKANPGREDDMQSQQAMITRIQDLCRDVRENMHVTDETYAEEDAPQQFDHTSPASYISTHDQQGSMAAGSWSAGYTAQPSTGPYMFPTGPLGETQTPPGPGYYWLPHPHYSQIPQFVSQPAHTETPAEIVAPPDLAPPHDLRDRPRRAPDHYTPGTDAIPRRRRRRD